MTPELKLALEKIIQYGKNYSVGIIILSIVDVAVGIASIFLAFMYIPVFSSIAVMFKVTRTAIQSKKLQKVALVAFPIVVEYIKIRKKEKLKMLLKKFKAVLENICKYVFGNKLTITEIVVAAGFGYSIYILAPFGFILNVIAGLNAFVIGTLIALFLGLESLKQIDARLKVKDEVKAKIKADKEHAKKVKEYALKLKEEQESRLKVEAERLLKEAIAKSAQPPNPPQ